MQRRWLSIAILASVLAVGGCQGPGTAPTVGQAVSNPAQKASVSFSVAAGRAGYALKQLGAYKVEDVARINAHVHNHVSETNTPAASPMASAWKVLPANGVFNFTLGNLDYGTRYWLRLEALRADGTVIGVIDEYSPGNGSPQTYTDANNQRFQWFETLGASENQLQAPVSVLIKLADAVYSGQAPVQIGFINGGFSREVGPVTIMTPTPSTSPIPSSETAQYAMSTLAGSGIRGYLDGLSSAAQFSTPTGLTVDAAGNVFVTDGDNHRIRRISPDGNVSTVAGSGEVGFFSGGYADGAGSQARFRNPRGIALDSLGNLIVADYENHRIRKITPAGDVSTLAGSGEWGFADGPGSQAQFKLPFDVAVDTNGNVYVTDSQNYRIRKVTPAGIVSTLAGSGNQGFADGMANEAQFDHPLGLAVDANGNVYVADSNNNPIRKITPSGVVSTVAGSGNQNVFLNGWSEAELRAPTDVVVDSAGNLLVADWFNNRIGQITSKGEVRTLTGPDNQSLSNQASPIFPQGLAVDQLGNVLVSDSNRHLIHRISRLP